MRQIIGTASNHYDLINEDGSRTHMVELVLIGMAVEYRAEMTGLRKVESTTTDRFSVTLKQLGAIIEQLQEIVALDDEMRLRFVGETE